MNLFLGRELVKGPLRRLDRTRMAALTQQLLDELDVRIDSPYKTIRTSPAASDRAWRSAGPSTGPTAWC